LRKFKWWLNRKNRQTARNNMWDYYLTINDKGVLVSNAPPISGLPEEVDPRCCRGKRIHTT